MGHQAEGVTIVTNTQGTTYPSPANTYHIPVLLVGNWYSFLVDTGAAISLISSVTWERCCIASKRHQKLVPWHQPRLVGVNGSPLAVRVSLFMPFVVAEGISSEGILGLDFLERYGWIIDFGSQSLQCKRKEILVELKP
jgi:hypothetical protein